MTKGEELGFCNILQNEIEFGQRRAGLFIGPVVKLWQSYSQLKSFWLPEHLNEPSRSATAKQVHFILRTAIWQSNGCWVWGGSKNGGYPCVIYNGTYRGALKVLLSHLCDEFLEHFVSRRVCRTRLCVNPAHHDISCGFNVPVWRDGYEQLEFWSDPHLLPWQHKVSGTRVEVHPEGEIMTHKIVAKAAKVQQLEENQKAFKEALRSAKPAALIGSENARDFFKIAPKTTENS